MNPLKSLGRYDHQRSYHVSKPTNTSPNSLEHKIRQTTEEKGKGKGKTKTKSTHDLDKRISEVKIAKIN
jgi:hypothetical protein